MHRLNLLCRETNHSSGAPRYSQRTRGGDTFRLFHTARPVSACQNEFTATASQLIAANG